MSVHLSKYEGENMRPRSVKIVIADSWRNPIQNEIKSCHFYLYENLNIQWVRSWRVATIIKLKREVKTSGLIIYFIENHLLAHKLTLQQQNRIGGWYS